MAFFEMKFHSDMLRMGVSVNVILPENAKTLIGMNGKTAEEYKTLYLLHGLSDDHSIWMRRTSIERYASERGIAVVMPAVGRSWYTDTVGGANYLSFITRELPSVCRSYFRGMSEKREDNAIAGLSMGGYGAVKAALSAPDVFFGCASLSGALDIASFGGVSDVISEWKTIFSPDLKSAEDLRGTKHDLFYLLDKLIKKGSPLPKMYMWCGKEDFLLEQNHRFVSYLNSLSIEHTYEESEGNHSWKFWDMHIKDALEFLF